MVELLRSAANYRGQGSLEGWARTIAMRSVIRWMRRQAPAATSHEEVQSDATADSASTFVLDHLPRPLEAYLDELTKPQRIALLLRCSLGCTIPEVATLTDSPIPTVKSRVTRAMEILRGSIRRDIRFGARTQAQG